MTFAGLLVSCDVLLDSKCPVTFAGLLVSCEVLLDSKCPVTFAGLLVFCEFRGDLLIGLHIAGLGCRNNRPWLPKQSALAAETTSWTLCHFRMLKRVVDNKYHPPVIALFLSLCLYCLLLMIFSEIFFFKSLQVQPAPLLFLRRVYH